MEWEGGVVCRSGRAWGAGVVQSFCEAKSTGVAES